VASRVSSRTVSDPQAGSVVTAAKFPQTHRRPHRQCGTRSHTARSAAPDRSRGRRLGKRLTCTRGPSRSNRRTGSHDIEPKVTSRLSWAGCGARSAVIGSRVVSIVGMRVRSSPTAEDLVVSPADLTVRAVSPPFPLQGDRLAVKVAPFAAGAVLAEVSLVLPPGVYSVPAAVISVLLLAATAAEFLLPWQRLPKAAAVAVPLTYCASALALLLAAGPTSGIGIALLIPVVWTAMYHTKWESACVVIAVVIVEFVVSSAQDDLDGTIIRRVVLWALLGAVISVAVHALRDRVLAAHRRSEQLADQLRSVELTEDRLRIALTLQEQVFRGIFDATITLRGASRAGDGEEARKRIDTAVDQLDQTVNLLRRTVFDIQTADQQTPTSR
jgi:hypothetical protein